MGLHQITSLLDLLHRNPCFRNLIKLLRGEAKKRITRVFRCHLSSHFVKPSLVDIKDAGPILSAYCEKLSVSQRLLQVKENINNINMTRPIKAFLESR